MLAIAVTLAAAGWLLDTQTRVESDIQKLVPQDLPALRDLDALQRSTGVGGEIDVIIQGADLTRPAVLNWMIGYQTGVLKRFRYSATRGCGTAELCPAFSLPDLFTTPASRRDAGAIEDLLDAVPPYFSQSVVSADRRTATLAFGIRLMDLERQGDVIAEMRARLREGRPAGVRADLAGLPVLAADANAQVASNLRRMLTLLAGLLAVAVVLLAALRSVQRALVPLVPIALATGWSALVLFALRVPLNPMSVTLGALVIAISTEFSVLLSERYRAERAQGHAPRDALQRTYRSTGAAVLASGATAIAGFAVLVVSDIRMLRDFGFVTVVDLTVSLLGVMLVLPAVLLLAERRAARRASPAPPAREAPGGQRSARMSTASNGPLGFGPEPDRVQPAGGPTDPVPPPPGRVAGHRYAWLLAIAAILAVAALSIHGARPDAPRASGVRTGETMPPFAVVRAMSAVVCDDDDDPCDANVARRTGQGGAGRRPACEVRGPTVLNVCELYERGPVVLALAVSRGASCLDAFEHLAALARRHPGLQVALVAIGGGLQELRASVRARGWSFPVGWDRDAILAGVYGVAACPYVTVARRGGRVQGTLVGERADLEGELERLAGAAVAASRRAGWRP